jgi:putative FmdB family regulatory protein
MPIYEYQCSKCESKFEVLRSMSKMDDDAGCPKCEGVRFSAFSKGMGGLTTSLNTDGCSSCSSSSCDTCH